MARLNVFVPRAMSDFLRLHFITTTKWDLLLQRFDCAYLTQNCAKNISCECKNQLVAECVG